MKTKTAGTRIIAPHHAPGARRTLEVVEVWRAIDRITHLGAGLGGIKTVEVWVALMLMRDSSGDVEMDREHLARLVGITPARVSRILTALETVKLIKRRRDPIDGMRGPGKVVIVIP
jgi:CRP-like cAMP-binding protein